MRPNDIIGMMASVFDFWQPELANPNYVRKDGAVTWNSRNRAFLSNPVSPEGVEALVAERQYSFQFLGDGGILQLYYSFGPKNVLHAASLGFYSIWPQQIPEEEDDVEDGYTGEPPQTGQLLTDQSPSSVRWLRLDYDPDAAKGVLHPACHLHMAGCPMGRLSVNAVPTPKQFVDLVVALFYPDVYRRKRLGESGGFQNGDAVVEWNSGGVPSPDKGHEGCIIGIRVP